jgi:peptidoglycan hydrolase CwlO-like protein
MLIKRINKSLLLIALGIIFLAATPIMVKAESLQQQIDTLQNTNKSVQSNIDNLQVQATSYQDAVRILQTQINSAQNAINASQKSIDDLQVKIDKAQKDLDYQKQVLGSNVRAIYVSGSSSTVEELASSKNLSVYVDQQTYHKAVEGKIQKTLNQIADLQNQLNSQKAQVQQTLAVQKTQNDQLVADQKKQQDMLGYNQSQQDKYNQDIAGNKDKIAALKAQQAALNSAGSGSRKWWLSNAVV